MNVIIRDLPIFHSFDCLSSFIVLVVFPHIIKHLGKVLLQSDLRVAIGDGSKLETGFLAVGIGNLEKYVKIMLFMCTLCQLPFHHLSQPSYDILSEES